MPYDLTMTATPAYATGDTGFDLELSGGYGYISAAEFPSNAAITIECRIKTSVSGVIQVMMGQNNQFFLALYTDGTLFFNYNGIGNITTSAVINDNIYHHIRMCLNATDGYVFVDGVLANHQTTGYTFNSGATANVAVREFGGVIGSFPWSGRVDEPAIWDICTNTSGFTPPSAPYAGNEANLVRLWHLDGDGLSGIVTGTSVALTGVTGGGGIGMLTPVAPSGSVALTGVAAAGTKGLLTPARAMTLTGVAAVGAAGTLRPHPTVALTGMRARGRLGALGAPIPSTRTGPISTIMNNSILQAQLNSAFRLLAWPDPVAVANLPPAIDLGVGAHAFVTDATSGTFGDAAVGGGSNKVPVYSDGADWFIG